MSDEIQALCYFAGANSIFYGEKLLTADNPETSKDLQLLEKLGLCPQLPDRSQQAPVLDQDAPASPCLAEDAEVAPSCSVNSGCC